MSETPETDDQQTINAIDDNGYQVPCVDIDFARKLERERDEAQERECAAIESWQEEHQMALREGQRVVEAREQNAKLRDIAERLFAAVVGRMKANDWRAFRAELDQLKEGAK